MSLLTTVNDVCAAVGVHQTTSVFASINANRTMFEMLALANEMAQRIAYDMRDWTILRTMPLAALVGDGPGPDPDNPIPPRIDFPFPANFKRMLLTTNVWRSSNVTTPMRFIPDTDEWLNRRARNISHGPGEWMLAGNSVLVHPGLTAAESINYAYLDKNCITIPGTPAGLGDRFTQDVDSYRLDERLLKLGMIWQWKANKGSPYAEDMGTWGDAMALAMGKDTPGPIIIGRLPISAGTRVAYPWPVPTP